MTVYIAGKMKGDPDYRIKFNRAQKKLEEQGYTVLNPAVLPEGLPQDKYMPICLAMIEAADEVCMIGYDWLHSKGANVEKHYAVYQGKEIIYEVEI